MAHRVGPKMAEVIWYVRHNPGCTQHAAAKYAGPNGSPRWGSQTVQRALAAGLIRNAAPSYQHYELHVTEKGEAVGREWFGPHFWKDQ